MDEYTGIIIAGGKSSRMGKDKGLVKYKGKALIEYSIQVLKEYCTHLLISSNNEEYRKFGFTVIQDEVKGIGPLGGIYSTLKVSDTNKNIVLPCDTPYIQPELIARLISESQDSLMTIPAYRGQIEPLCVVYSKDIIPEIEKAIKNSDYKLQNLIRHIPHKLVEIKEEYKIPVTQMFVNFNTETDLMKAYE